VRDVVEAERDGEAPDADAQTAAPRRRP